MPEESVNTPLAGEVGHAAKTTTRLGGKALGVLAVTVVSLLTNGLTIAQQGVEKWWASIISNGKLQIVWVGSERLPGISIQAKGEDGKGLEFDPDAEVSLAAGRYAIKVTQFDRQLPVALVSSSGKEINHAEVARFRTTVLRIKPNPTDPVFSGVYDLVADALGGPKAPSRRLPRVYQGFHQNGTMLWFFDTNTFFVLRASDGTWTEVPDAPYSEDGCLYSQDCIDAREHPPKGLHVPIGGGYRVWNTFKKDLGWMTGYCIYWDTVVREDFEHGFLVGPLRTSRIGEIALSISLFSDKDRKLWRSPTLFGVQPAACQARN
jgi:hypothetical protein